MVETPLSPMAVYTARPTVRINTQAYPKVSELMISMEMTEQEGGMSSLELRVSNVASDPSGSANLAFDDDQIMKLGATIAIYSGDENSPQQIFSGIITGLEGSFPQDQPPELVVLAEDVFQRARMNRRTEVHDNVSISDLAHDLAGQLSLTPVVTGFTTPIGVHVQLNESDLAFLRRILRRYDGDLQVVGTELHVSRRADVQRGTLELTLNSQLRSARALADLAHQVTEVTTGGWNSVQGQRVKGTSMGSSLGPGSGQTGSQVCRDAIGVRSRHVGHLTVSTDAEAQALADATFDSHARRFVYVEGSAEGNPALRVGTCVKLAGLGGRFDNTYYVVRTSHHFDQDHGYETSFEAECAYLGSGS